MNYLGKHWILELYDCPADLLSDPSRIGVIMANAAKAMKATIVEQKFHHFSPLGVSGVIIIKESHLTIHTWPEYGYAAIDIFTCGAIDMDKGIAHLKKHLASKESSLNKLGRGLKDKLIALQDK